MSGALSWKYDGRNWPNRDSSRFVSAGRIRWHVQIAGTGPCLLMLHGTGSATNSWAGLLPILRDGFTVVAPDLPGHGFTSAPASSRMSLPGFATAVADLCAELEVDPRIIVGHSAGAAIGVQMTLEGYAEPDWIVSLNGALLPLRGIAGTVFSPLAKLLAGTLIVPWLFSIRAADRRVVERLVRETGSRIDRQGIDRYATLARNAGHVRAALEMMANWQLQPLARDLPRLQTSLLLLAGKRDRTVPPHFSQEAGELAPHAEFRLLPDLGHLAHEERPDAIAPHIVDLGKALTRFGTGRMAQRTANPE